MYVTSEVSMYHVTSEVSVYHVTSEDRGSRIESFAIINIASSITIKMLPCLLKR